MANFALIPARAGSKRIKHKNIKRFCGKPLIAYSIEVAKQSGLFDDIIVSTDSEEIATYAQSLGASVPFIRPAELSDDFAGTREVIQHAINQLHSQNNVFEYCCCIYATAPFLRQEYLVQGLEALKANKTKAFAFSTTTFAFPVQRALTLKNNILTPLFEKHMFTRSQDLDEAIHDAGQFYWGSTKDLLSDKAFFSEHSIPVHIPRHLVQDIDTLEDWTRAELMYQSYVSNT